LISLDKELIQVRELLGLKPLPQEEEDQTEETEILPVGIGLLTFHNDDPSGLIPLIRRHRPVATWLFAQASQQHAALISALKPAGASWNMKIFVQIGSVRSAMLAVQEGADVIVVQGSDAGGHQFAKNASLMTLLPEVSDAVRDVRPDIPILAAGGIMDGRGIVAALALGMAFLLTREFLFSFKVTFRYVMPK
jgi:nitronate monooxygenase